MKKINSKKLKLLQTILAVVFMILVPAGILIMFGIKKYAPELYNKMFLFKKKSSNTQSGNEVQGDKSLPRGVRNNNPLNIREIYKNGADTTQWAGERATNDDPSFEEFTTMKDGAKASLKLLRSYIKNGHNTIRKIVNRWAPPSDGNNTSEYVKNVGRRTGFHIDSIVTDSMLVPIAYAMAISEIGQKYAEKYAPKAIFLDAYAELLAGK